LLVGFGLILSRYFALQLAQIASKGHLPLFLHCRNAATNLRTILNENSKALGSGGVVHSFDGSIEEMKTFLELGLHIGINGWLVYGRNKRRDYTRKCFFLNY